MEILKLLVTATAFKLWFFIIIFDIFFLYSYYRGDKKFLKIISLEKQNVCSTLILSLILSIPLLNWATILVFLVFGSIASMIIFIEHLIDKLTKLREKNQEKINGSDHKSNSI